MLSPELQRILGRSADEARWRCNPVVTLEHALHAMAGDPTGAELLAACGARPRKLRADLERSLDALPTTGGEALDQAPELQAVLVRAATHASSTGHPEITAGGFLAELLFATTTHAVAALTLQGVTRLSVTSYLSHAETRRTARTAPPVARLVAGPGFAPGMRHVLARIGRALWRWVPGSASARYEVVFHNDDYTTRAFVIELLVGLFARSRDDAEAFTQEVHARGRGSVGRYPRREAQALVARATAAARRAEFPLRLTIVRAR